MTKAKHKGQFKKGMTPWNKGMKMSLDYRKKLSEIHRTNPNRYWLGKKRPDLDLSNRILPTGEDHWNWKGGVTKQSEKERKSVEYKEWRKRCFERDEFTCQCCGTHGGDLRAHHLNNFAEHDDLKYDISNGLTMCKKCHREFHVKYGFTNNTKGQMEEFLEEA